MSSVPNSLDNIKPPAQVTLLSKLQRFSLVGWLLFVVTAFFFIAYVFIDKLTPEPIVAIDDRGHVLGKFEYMNPNSRSKPELLGAGAYFIENYLSLNSSTIVSDSSNWLEMTCESLRKKKLEEMKKTNYIARIEQANTRTKVYFSDDEKTKPKVVVNPDGSLSGIYQGTIRFVDSGKLVKPFKVALDFNIVPRSILRTHGVEVCKIEDL